MEDNLIIENEVKEYQKRSYQDLSSEFQRLYPRVVQLIPLMYNRLSLVDNLSHKQAVAKIYNDHQHLSRFSRRNIRRNLPLDNATVPRRIRPSWPKNSVTETAETSELSDSIQGQQQGTAICDDSKETFTKTSEQKTQQQITPTQDAVDDTSTNTEAYPISSDGVNEPFDQSKQNEIANNEERTRVTGTKEELGVTNLSIGEIAPINKQNEDMIDSKKERFVSHVSMSLANLQKDIDAVSRTTKGVSNIFFEVLVDLGTCEVKIEFCGRRKRKNRSMTSMGKGALKEAD